MNTWKPNPADLYISDLNSFGHRVTATFDNCSKSLAQFTTKPGARSGKPVAFLVSLVSHPIATPLSPRHNHNHHQ